MADKSFNEQPMLVVVSDALDPRIKRQLQSQLQAEMMTVGQLDAEIKNQESMQAIKQQYDSTKDESKFDDNETKEEATPAPVEQQPQENQNDDTGTEANANEQPTDQGVGTETASDFQNNGAAPEANAQQPPTPQPEQETPAKPESTGQTEDDPFSTGDQSPPAKPEPEQAQQPAQAQEVPPKAEPAQKPQAAAQPQANGNGADKDDPFSDDVKFEAFAGIFNDGGVKFEDAEKQSDATKDTHPPLKQVVYVAASDRGVDERTNHVVASLEDPQNTVVILDLTDVAEAEAKMQFSAMKKSLQDRGVTVMDTIDQTVEYLNDVYDQIGGKTE